MTYQEEITKVIGQMTKTGTTISNVVKVVDDNTLVDAPDELVDTINKTNKFLSRISQSLKQEGLDHDIINIGIMGIGGSVRKHISMNSKCIHYNGVGSFVVLLGDGWFVRIGNAEFYNKNIPNCMFLEHIEVDKKSKGLGTHIMNIILDVCDEINESLTCVPTDIKGKPGKLEKIRSWYSSLEFKKVINNSIFYRYSPK